MNFLLNSYVSLSSLPVLAAEEAHAVPKWMTVVFGIILAAMIAALALEEKIHAKKSIIVGSFAGLCLILATLMGLMDFGPVQLPDGHKVPLPVYIPSIDWGLLTLISSVPNIIVGKAAGISFGRFFFVAAPYVAVATIVTLLMARVRFGIKGLKTDEEKQQARQMVESFDPNESISSKRFFWFSVGALVLFILCLAGQSALPFGLNKLEMGFVALFFAGVVLYAYKHEVDKFYSAVDWDLLAFFAALFVVIHVMEHAQVLAFIGSGISQVLQWPDRGNSAVLLTSSAVASSVTDNIPLAAMLAQILQQLETDPDSPFLWCVIFGANLGGNLTPIGSASTVVAMTIIQRQKLNLTFVGFVKKAAPFAVVQIILATVYLLIRF